MSNENDAEQLRKAQQQLGPILRFIANQPVGVPPSLAAFSAANTSPMAMTIAGHDAHSVPVLGVGGVGGALQTSAAVVDAQQAQHMAAALKHLMPMQAMLPAGTVLSLPGTGMVATMPPPLTLATAYTADRLLHRQAPGTVAAVAAAAAAATPPPLTAGVASPAVASGSVATATHAMAAASRVSSAGPVATGQSLASMDESAFHKAPANQVPPLGAAGIENDSADEDEDDSPSMATSAPSSSRKSDHRRAAHTSAEQKRRDDIKHGYEDLAALIPSCQANNNNGQKLSKAVILQRSIDYLGYLKKQRQQQEQDLVALRNEVVALRIMKRNYEQIAKVHNALPPEKAPQVSDAAKFEVFKAVMDTLFQSFDACISVSNFEVLSSSIFQWLEEFCKPQNMRGIVISSLQTLQKQPAGSMYGSRS